MGRQAGCAEQSVGDCGTGSGARPPGSSHAIYQLPGLTGLIPRSVAQFPFFTN